MTPAARNAGAIGILDHWLGGQPLEAAYQGWARGARYAGSSDRAAVRDLIYDAARRRRSYAALGGSETGRGLVIGALRAAGIPTSDVFSGQGHAPPPLSQEELDLRRTPGRAEALDLPDWLIAPFEAALGPETEQVLHLFRDRAQTHLRINGRNGDRDQVIARLAEAGVVARPHPTVDTAVIVDEGGRRLPRSGVIDAGLAELQDAASQRIVAWLCRDAPGRVLDYCSGAGGKALAFADMTGAEVVAHDIAPARMADLPARAARAGVAIATCATADLPRLKPFDLVFCDAPCSGSGTWRRDPEAKWRLTPERLRGFAETQAEVLETATGLVAEGGSLAYATCSVLREENEVRVEAFLRDTPGWRLADSLRITPTEASDGFFVAVFRRV
ncbi:RsmB/NOP family class I SAM-dependent RNA methyltransferase [Roseisalinus antarcticus]|uniref:Ribosomal RNA small subunit methyltransferase B n=1 Tax=Roseisalinus antarcticus TaxID=254357 RepID=A0A1Y5RBH9_9RHOB|nr:RsmB/NOP family class I SAM-dependent RNA methyltransferase [Roseisalinus antarcticus]SLN13570.1 Ribosomal RNA small subunit methyltransferase B [Roseisalinus antarcticus]